VLGEDVGHSALSENTFEQLVGNGFDISVLLEQLHVDVQIGETKIVKSHEVRLEVCGNIEFIEVVLVEFLHDLNLDVAVRTTLVSDNRLFLEGREAEFGDHNGALLNLRLFAGDVLGNKFRAGDDHGLLNHLFVSLLHHLNLAPDLVSKSDVCGSGHTEEGSVATGLGRGLEGSNPVILGVRVDSGVEGNGGSSHLVSTGLNEEQVSGPGSHAIVSEGPGLCELLAGLDLVSIGEALLNKATRVSDVVLLATAGLAPLLLLGLTKRSSLGLGDVHFLGLGLFTLAVLELADELVGSL